MPKRSDDVIFNPRIFGEWLRFLSCKPEQLGHDLDYNDGSEISRIKNGKNSRGRPMRLGRSRAEAIFDALVARDQDHKVKTGLSFREKHDISTCEDILLLENDNDDALQNAIHDVKTNRFGLYHWYSPAEELARCFKEYPSRHEMILQHAKKSYHFRVSERELVLRCDWELSEFNFSPWGSALQNDLSLEVHQALKSDGTDLPEDFLFLMVHNAYASKICRRMGIRARPYPTDSATVAGALVENAMDGLRLISPGSGNSSFGWPFSFESKHGAQLATAHGHRVNHPSMCSDSTTKRLLHALRKGPKSIEWTRQRLRAELASSVTTGNGRVSHHIELVEGALDEFVESPDTVCRELILILRVVLAALRKVQTSKRKLTAADQDAVSELMKKGEEHFDWLIALLTRERPLVPPCAGELILAEAERRAWDYWKWTVLSLVLCVDGE